MKSRLSSFAMEKSTKRVGVYETFLDSFVAGAKQMKLPKLDDEWSFSFGVSEYGAAVSIGNYEIISQIEVQI